MRAKKMVKKIHEIAHHRNGVGGNGFYAVRFQTINDGDTLTMEMVATVFEEQGNCAVLCLDYLQKDGNATVAFGHNSWRGDTYEKELRAAIDKKAMKDYGCKAFE